jgi:glycosyltransferase involved in cell wall biosynthesis
VSTGRWEEYVGMTNLQAMACGLPVVSTRSGAIPEYVPATAGLLVPQRDPQALAGAVLDLLSDPARRERMGQAGRAHAVEFYDARRSVLRAEEELLCLLDRRGIR